MNAAMRIGVLSTCLLAGAAALGVDPPAPPQTVEQVCKLTVCRPATEIKLNMGQGRYYVIDQPMAPYTYDGVINVIANETVAINAKTKDDKILDFNYVPDAGKATPVIVTRLQQYVDSKGQNSMLLSVTNPFDRPLVYTATIQPAGKKQFQPTSICPVQAHRVGEETWPYPLVQVLLKDFRFLAKDEAIDKDCLAAVPAQ
jgi:hypothetical protein